MQLDSNLKVLYDNISTNNLKTFYPKSTNYFLSPSAYGLRKGEGYYQNIWVLLNQVSYGITNNFSVGVGVIPLFLFDVTPTPVFATVKLSIPIVKNKVNIAGGGILGTFLGEDESGFGSFYGISTFGNPNNNFSVGLGYGFIDGEWATAPTLNFSGMFRLGSRNYFLTENYFSSVDGDNVFVISVGGRWMINKANLDYGLFFPFDSSDFGIFPWVGFSIPFGNY